jgi:hypothetical protein
MWATKVTSFLLNRGAQVLSDMLSSCVIYRLGSIDCTVSEWSSWSQCPASCVPTMQYRIRKIIKNAFNGGRCYGLKEKRQCNERGCRESNNNDKFFCSLICV